MNRALRRPRLPKAMRLSPSAHYRTNFKLTKFRLDQRRRPRTEHAIFVLETLSVDDAFLMTLTE
jgi:hypothetical protein